MHKSSLTAEQAQKKGLCEKCREKPLESMHYCGECLAVLREKGKARRAKKGS